MKVKRRENNSNNENGIRSKENPIQNPPNYQNSPKDHNSKPNKNQGQTEEKKKINYVTMTTEGICLFCGTKHDSSECLKGKFKFYTVKEAQLLTRANLTPKTRTQRPEHRFTEETPFIKKALEILSQTPKKV